MQIVQPVIARGKDEPPVVVCPQRRLIHLQLDGVQNGLLAHGFYNAAGAQHRQAALDPQMRLKVRLAAASPPSMEMTTANPPP